MKKIMAVSILMMLVFLTQAFAQNPAILINFEEEEAEEVMFPIEGARYSVRNPHYDGSYFTGTLI